MSIPWGTPMLTDVIRCDRVSVELESNRYGAFSVSIRLYLGDKRVRDELYSHSRPRAAALRDMIDADALVSLRISRGTYLFVSGEKPDVRVD